MDGERALFHDLIRPDERSIYITLLGMLQNSADAEDAAQETMFKAYRSLAVPRRVDAKREDLEGDQTPALLTDWRPVPTEAMEQ